MQMDKRKIVAVCLVALLLAPSGVSAADNCRIAAASLKTLPEKTITVPVAITGNPGFTNFAITLEYDADRLELTGIQTASGEKKYLSSVNTAWQTADGKTKTCGFITAASGETVTGDGDLFQATFLVKGGFAGKTVITPRVQYLRSFVDTFSDMDVTVQQAEITVIAYGDITMDGVIEYDDVILAYEAAAGKIQLTPEQTEIGDLVPGADDAVKIDMDDVRAIYNIYTGGE